LFFLGCFFWAGGDATTCARILADMSTSTSPPGAERILTWIMVALVAWGLFHAVGAWMLNHDARRPLIVIACMAAFLGFWLALLASRKRRLAHLRDGTREPRS
jgi:hypothetical protein